MPKLHFKTASDLVTSKEQTRAGFVSMALEKNYLATEYVDEAKALKGFAAKVDKPIDLLTIDDLQPGLLTASGLSDKSQNYLTKEDKDIAIKGLIEKYLEPAGENFIDELIYRYLLIKGDALGGKARNLAGVLGERKFLRCILSTLKVSRVSFEWKDRDTEIWLQNSDEHSDIEKRIKALHWKKRKNRLLVLNYKPSFVNKNVDIVILEGDPREIRSDKMSILHKPEKYIALGELKGGIDPAGADEHWKTANSALQRIKTSFKKKGLNPPTFFIGAAIEAAMADEIFGLLKSKELSNAANLTNEDQLVSICEWIVNI